VSYGQQALASGRSVGATAEELGLCDKTLRDWLAKENAKPSQSVTALRAVVVKPSASMTVGSLTLVTPGGYRVAGLDVESASALLRVLG
jgi:transposase-like protein